MMSFGSSSVWMCKSILIQSSFSVISVMRDKFIANEQISYFVLVTVIDSVPITSRSRSRGRIDKALASLGPPSTVHSHYRREANGFLLKKLGWWNGRHVRLRGV